MTANCAPAIHQLFPGMKALSAPCAKTVFSQVKLLLGYSALRMTYREADQLAAVDVKALVDKSVEIILGERVSKGVDELNVVPTGGKVIVNINFDSCGVTSTLP